RRPAGDRRHRQRPGRCRPRRRDRAARPRGARGLARRLDAGAQPGRWTDLRARGAAVRIVIGEDSVLLRAGITRLLADAGEEVIAAVGDGDELVAAVERHKPDLVIADVRMPPTFSDEGIRAALEI